MILSSSLAAISALITFLDKENGSSWQPGRMGLVLLLACMLILGLLDSGGRLLGLPTLHWLDLRLSPYKGLYYALQYPGARVIFSRWNAFSRIDVVNSPRLTLAFRQALVTLPVASHVPNKSFHC